MIARICKRGIAVIGVMVFAILALYAGRYSIFRGYDGIYVNTHDQLGKNILCFVAVIGLLLLMKKLPDNTISRKVIHIFAVVSAGLVYGACCWLIKSAEFIVITDPMQMYYAIKALVEGVETDFVSMGQGYFALYPYQLSLISLYAVILKVGRIAVSVRNIEYMHAFFLAMAVYAGYRVVRELSDNLYVELIYLLLMLGCGPMYFYAMYIYGETLGICASLMAVWMLIRGNQEGESKRKKILCFAGAMIFIVLACVARGALLVVWIAMAIMQGIILLRRKDFFPMIFVLLMLPAIFLGQSGLQHYAEAQVYGDVGSGSPKIMWIAMGLQENEENYLGPGSYNGFNADTFVESGYNTDLVKREAQKVISCRIQYFLSHPSYGISFFKRKVLCQWNEPTYGAFFHTYYMDDRTQTVDRIYFEEDLHGRIINYFNRYQFVFYLGVTFYFIYLLGGNKDEAQYLVGLILIGGFCLSLIWESGSRYVYPYVVMSLPCAAIGIKFCIDRLEELWSERVRARRR